MPQTLSTPEVSLLRLSAGEIKFYKDEGWLLIPGLLSESQAETLHGEVMTIMNQIGLSLTKLKQTSEYLAGSALDSYVNSANLRAIAEQLMGGESSLYMPFTAVKSSSGGRFNFHQDNQYTRLDGPALNIWTALTPMSPENGCLQIIPRSHFNGTLGSRESEDGDGHRKIEWEPSDFLPVRMRPGDAVVFSRLTIHGSGPNQTDDPRVAYAVQFARNDANWLDRESGEWKNLVQHPRWNTAPVTKISIPTSKQDGH
jgi:ectoine hydroxylase-related dioxygenase (phytanoyl-CoA dioxygenase family)